MVGFRVQQGLEKECIQRLLVYGSDCLVFYETVRLTSGLMEAKNLFYPTICLDWQLGVGSEARRWGARHEGGGVIIAQPHGMLNPVARTQSCL
jgi:hypothetical protein